MNLNKFFFLFLSSYQNPDKPLAFPLTRLSSQANLISEDIESAISDSKGGKQKRRPEVLRWEIKRNFIERNWWAGIRWCVHVFSPEALQKLCSIEVNYSVFQTTSFSLRSFALAGLSVRVCPFLFLHVSISCLPQSFSHTCRYPGQLKNMYGVLRDDPRPPHV